MAAEVETVSQMDTAVPVLLVVGLESCEDAELDLARVSIFLYGSDDLDGDAFATAAVPSLDDLAECPLAQEFDHLVCG